MILTWSCFKLAGWIFSLLWDSKLLIAAITFLVISGEQKDTGMKP